MPKIKATKETKKTTLQFLITYITSHVKAVRRSLGGHEFDETQILALTVATRPEHPKKNVNLINVNLI
jgi:hypothetical protein